MLGQSGRLPRIHWEPPDDFLEILLISNYFRAFIELISGKILSSSVEYDTICQ
jgi:hypothetical protein